jgi:hypothetical protein
MPPNGRLGNYLKDGVSRASPAIRFWQPSPRRDSAQERIGAPQGVALDDRPRSTSLDLRLMHFQSG